MSAWPANSTGAAGVTHFYDQAGQRITPILLSLTEHDAALVWSALYQAYGNEHRADALWDKFRRAVGESRMAVIAEDGSEIGREKHPAHPADEFGDTEQ